MKYGFENGVFVEPVQVILHLPEGWTKILFVRMYGLGLADGGGYWDIPTELIPIRLRAIGSRFVISARMGQREQIVNRARESWRENLEVMELPNEERHLWPTRKLD